MLNRRDLLFSASGAMAAGLLTGCSAGRGARPTSGPRAVRALAFDAFPVFDPRPVFGLVQRLVPDRGAALADAWRTRTFEYQWLRALGGRYVDFRQAADEALSFAAKAQGIELTPDVHAQLMNAYLNLGAWPDAPDALRALRADGLQLAFLSNATPAMLEAGIRTAGLGGVFQHVISTDSIRSFKPDPRAYRLGVETFGLDVEEILFVAFAGWDVAGAKWFGYPTFWVNRLGLPAEELGATADGTGRTLDELVAFVRKRNAEVST